MADVSGVFERLQELLLQVFHLLGIVLLGADFDPFDYFSKVRSRAASAIEFPFRFFPG